MVQTAIETGRSESALLERFAESGDPAAFAELVRRFGSLVTGVGRRLLNTAEDRDDAFQATFLILARKAPSLRDVKSLGSWLYVVSVRIAQNMNLEARARRTREKEAAKMARTSGPSATNEDVDAAWGRLRPIVDEELSRLPEKYRSALVLCYLEGKSNDAAAAQLGWPRGTMWRRLTRGLEVLRGRLDRRGVVLPAALIAAALTGKMASASAPAAVAAAVHAAAAGTVSPQVAALAKGGLHAMMWAKVKVAAAAIVIATTASAAAGVAVHEVMTPAIEVRQDSAAVGSKTALTAESFPELHRVLGPYPGDYRWDQIPWVTDVWHARKRAAAEDKPILNFGTSGAGFNDPLANC
jgi:RNA polymerase sigma factor (sigma-70 family)